MQREKSDKLFSIEDKYVVPPPPTIVNLGPVKSDKFQLVH